MMRDKEHRFLRHSEWARFGHVLLIIEWHHLRDRLLVRFGSLADIAARPRHVRFTPDSGHSSAHVSMSAKCQKRTSSRISQAETKLGPRSKSRGNRGRDHLDDLFG